MEGAGIGDEPQRTVMFLLAPTEGLHDAQGAVGLEGHSGEARVEPRATNRGADTILAAAAESVAEGRGRGGDDGRVEEASVVVVVLHWNAAGAVRHSVHGRCHVMRRQREAEPVAGGADRRVASASAAAADVLAAVAGHFGETRRAGGSEEVVGRSDDERSIIGEYMPQ